MHEFLPDILFAEPKYIKGKTDNGKHEGKASEVRRIQEANEHLKEFLKDLPQKPLPQKPK